MHASDSLESGAQTSPAPQPAGFPASDSSAQARASVFHVGAIVEGVGTDPVPHVPLAANEVIFTLATAVAVVESHVPVVNGGSLAIESQWDDIESLEKTTVDGRVEADLPHLGRQEPGGRIRAARQRGAPFDRR